MRFIRTYWIGLLVGLLVAVGIVNHAKAQINKPLEISPTQLTISGFRGDQEERTLLLRPLSGGTTVQVTSVDLNRIDKLDVLPASAIQSQLADKAEIENGQMRVPLRVDLGAAPSGLFNGELLVRYGTGEQFVEQVVPLTIQIKEWWPIPLALLLLGVVLGIGLTTYRQQGRQRDEILVKLGQISTQIEADAELSQAFRQRIEANLIDVQTAFRSEDWETAKAKLGQAEKILDKWRKDRDNWMVQLRYYEDLQEKVTTSEKLPQEATYARGLTRGLTEAGRGASDFENAGAFRQRLDQLAGYLNQYLVIRHQLDDLESTIGRLGFSGESYRKTAQRLGDALDNLSPVDNADFDSAYKALQEQIESATQEATEALENYIESTPGVRGGALSLPQSSSIFEALLNPPPNIQASILGEQSGNAQWRLKLFQWASYLISVILLAGAGFNELYIGNATFGQNLWGDYFTLIAWGFGAEATRSAITDMVRKWDLPGVG